MILRSAKNIEELLGSLKLALALNNIGTQASQVLPQRTAPFSAVPTRFCFSAAIHKQVSLNSN